MGDTVKTVRTLGGLRSTVRELADAAQDQRGELDKHSQPGTKARGHFHDGQLLAFHQALELIGELHPAYRYAIELMAIAEGVIEAAGPRDNNGLVPSDLHRRATALVARIRAEEAGVEDVESHVIEALLQEGHSIASYQPFAEMIAALRADQIAVRVVDHD